MTGDLSVYVSAASVEVARAEDVVDALRMSGVLIEHDWCPDVRAWEGREVPDSVLRAAIAADVRAAARCDVLLLLHPPPGVPTVGAWMELGAAVLGAGDVSPIVCVSLGGAGASGIHPIARALATDVWGTDLAALAGVLRYRARRVFD